MIRQNILESQGFVDREAVADGTALTIGRYDENVGQAAETLSEAPKPFGFDSIVVGEKD